MLISSFEPIDMFDSILLPGNYLINNVKTIFRKINLQIIDSKKK